MKTIRQWLKERLSDEDYRKAEQYKNEYWALKERSFKDALYGAFNWMDTQEGSDYWIAILDNGGSLKTDPMRVAEHPIGLTKREYFAGLAMQSLLSSRKTDAYDIAAHSKEVSKAIVTITDELLKQLEL